MQQNCVHLGAHPPWAACRGLDGFSYPAVVMAVGVKMGTGTQGPQLPGSAPAPLPEPRPSLTGLPARSLHVLGTRYLKHFYKSLFWSLHFLMPPSAVDNYRSKTRIWDFPGVQWLRVCLPRRGTWVRFLVWDDSTCCTATEPRTTATETSCLDPVLCRRRSTARGSPRTAGKSGPTHRNQRKPEHSNETQHDQT